MEIAPISLEIGEKDPEKAYDAVRGKDSYLLESSDGSEKTARYSFIGFNPAAKLTIKGTEKKLETFDHQLADLAINGSDPLTTLRELTAQITLAEKPIARFFGGFVGYLSYDAIRHHVDLDTSTTDDLNQPDCEFILAKNNLIFDHVDGKTYLTQNEFSQNTKDIDTKNITEHLHTLAETITTHKEKPLQQAATNGRDYAANITQKEFEENVATAKDYIRAGDIFQVVLSQRLSTTYDDDPFHVYRTLKNINPSPYTYYLDYGNRKIVGSSPEMLTRVEDRKVMTYPIAGTRHRGKTLVEDKLLEIEMLADEKERAEHVMLVDLGRNDIGRVATHGSVRVTKFMEAEKYSHVQHIVSEVTGELAAGNDAYAALKSIFPAGTVSGAPKVRAMEIIEELEPTCRGIYAGAVGYVSFTGNLDTAIAIRTIAFEGATAHVQAGAGIVADSDPTREYEETLNKGKALLAALEVSP